MKTFKLFIFTTGLIFILSVISEAESAKITNSFKKYEIKYHIAKGDKFLVETVKTDLYVREVMGNEIKVKQKSGVRGEFLVKKADKGGMEVETKFNKIYETSGDPQAYVKPDFSPVYGQKITFILSPRGFLTNFKGFDKFTPIKNQSQQITYKREKYITLLKTIFPVLPKSPVKIGDTWEGEIITREPMPNGLATVKISFKNTLQKKIEYNQADCWQILSQYNILVTGKGSMQESVFEINMKGQGEDIIYFNISRGMIVLISGTSKLAGQAFFPGMEMSMRMQHQYTNNCRIEPESK